MKFAAAPSPHYCHTLKRRSVVAPSLARTGGMAQKFCRCPDDSDRSVAPLRQIPGMRRARHNAAKNMRDTVKQRATVVCQLGRRILLVSREGTRWSLPGGKPVTGEDLRETAMRELMEETRLHAMDMRYMFGFTGIHTCHHVFVATIADGEQPVPSNEITRCTWAKVTEVANLPVSTSTKGIVEVSGHGVQRRVKTAQRLRPGSRYRSPVLSLMKPPRPA